MLAISNLHWLNTNSAAIVNFWRNSRSTEEEQDNLYRYTETATYMLHTLRCGRLPALCAFLPDILSSVLPKAPLIPILYGADLFSSIAMRLLQFIYRDHRHYHRVTLQDFDRNHGSSWCVGLVLVLGEEIDDPTTGTGIAELE